MNTHASTVTSPVLKSKSELEARVKKSALSIPLKYSDPRYALLPPVVPYSPSTKISPFILTAENHDCLATPPIVSPKQVIVFKLPPTRDVTSTQLPC